MHVDARAALRRSLSIASPLATGCVAVLMAYPSSVAAQSAQTAGEPDDGSMVVLREIPTRPAQATGTGDTLEVSMAPNDAFADAIDLGLEELDDAQAALITSSALNGLNQLSQVEAGSAATDALIAETLENSGLSFLSNATNTSAGSIVSGSLDSSLANANAAIDGALGTVSSALSGLNGGGQ